MGTPTDVFAGVLLWLHDLPVCEGGNLDAIVNRCLQHRVAGLLVKATDAAHGYNVWAQLLLLRQKCQAAGIRFITWGYIYGSDPYGELSAAQQCIDFFSPDGHVLDDEQEIEDLADPVRAATIIAQGLKDRYPTLPLGHSPVSNVQGHLRSPYRQFADEGYVMLPQTYYVGYGWTPTYTVQSFYAAATQYNLLGNPIYPAYEDSPKAGVGSTMAQLQEFLGVLPPEVTGISSWVYDFLDAGAWARVDVATQQYPPPPSGSPVPDYEAQIAELTRELADETAAYDTLHTKLVDIQAVINR